MNLKELAVAAAPAALNGTLTLWMLPYLTFKSNVVNAAFADIVPSDQWETQHTTFVTCESLVVDVEVADNAPTEARGFALYWRERGDDLRVNWDAFTSAVGGQAILAFWEAYAATRDASYDAPEALNMSAEQVEELDPEAVGG